jgi:ParB family chromosome partitioning protein
VPDDRLLELALVENIQREPLNPLEEAQAYENLMETTGGTQEQVAERLGKDRSTVANSMRLLKLPPNVKKMVAYGRLTPGHARALLSSNSSASEMGAIAEVIIKKGWSVRDTERWAKRQTAPPSSLPKVQDPNEVAAANRLQMILGTKVDIQSKSLNKGEIRIHYSSQDELMRIYELLTEKSTSTEQDYGNR